MKHILSVFFFFVLTQSFVVAEDVPKPTIHLGFAYPLSGGMAS
jgi:hypothetical protein